MSSDSSETIQRLRLIQEEAAALYSKAYQIHERLKEPQETGFDFKLVPPYPGLLLEVKHLMDKAQKLKYEIAEEIRRLEEQP